MNKKNKLNIALLIIGISMVVLGAVLYFTVPMEIKDSISELHFNSFSWERGEWPSLSDRDHFSGAHGFDRHKPHGGIWIFPLIVLGLVLVFVFRKRHESFYQV